MRFKKKKKLKLKKKPVGILCFLGTLCEKDVGQALQNANQNFKYLWCKNRFDFRNFSAFILPGGFSYGDYLRPGLFASRTPAMEALREAARKGFPILGICNGFQILCEANLLPGVLLPNQNLKFIDQWVHLKLKFLNPFWGSHLKNISLPIAHGEGCYYAEKDELKTLYDNEQIWWLYDQNPNGSLHSIAGVMNKNKNIAGLMPHPERAIFDWMGSKDGLSFLENMNDFH